MTRSHRRPSGPIPITFDLQGCLLSALRAAAAVSAPASRASDTAQDARLASLADRLVERARARSGTGAGPAVAAPLMAAWGLPALTPAAAGPPAETVRPLLLDLRTEGQALVLEHRFLDGSQGPVYRDLDEPRRQVAIGLWRERMAGAYLGSRWLAHLLEDLMAAGRPGRDDSRIASRICQALEQARLCAGVTSALGGDARLWLPPLERAHTHPGTPPVEGILGHLIGLFCLGETVSLAHLELERRAAYSGASPAVIVVLEGLLADRIKQARLGFRLCDDLLATLDDEARHRLHASLEGIFEGAALHHHRATAGVAGLWSALGGGARPGSVGATTAASGQLAWELAVVTLDQVIVPALELRGLPARSTWHRVLARRGWLRPGAPRRPGQHSRDAA